MSWLSGVCRSEIPWAFVKARQRGHFSANAGKVHLVLSFRSFFFYVVAFLPEYYSRLMI